MRRPVHSAGMVISRWYQAAVASPRLAFSQAGAAKAVWESFCM